MLRPGSYDTFLEANIKRSKKLEKLKLGSPIVLLRRCHCWHLNNNKKNENKKSNNYEFELENLSGPVTVGR